MSLYQKIDDMTWPVPCRKMDNLEWQLRYGLPSMEDRLAAASLIAAYKQMIFDPQAKRRMIVSALRRGAYCDDMEGM